MQRDVDCDDTMCGGDQVVEQISCDEMTIERYDKRVSDMIVHTKECMVSMSCWF